MNTYVIRYVVSEDDVITTPFKYDDVNLAVFERNRLFANCPQIERIWIEVMSGEYLLRRWGAVLFRVDNHHDPVIMQQV